MHVSQAGLRLASVSWAPSTLNLTHPAGMAHKAWLVSQGAGLFTTPLHVLSKTVRPVNSEKLPSSKPGRKQIRAGHGATSQVSQVRAVRVIELRGLQV